METQEKQILVAEFMGWEVHPTMPQKLRRKGIEDGQRGLSDFCFIESLDFNTSWESLIPVVQKMSSLKESDLLEKESEPWLAYYGIPDMLLWAEPEQVFEEVVTVITWYKTLTE